MKRFKSLLCALACVVALGTVVMHGQTINEKATSNLGAYLGAELCEDYGTGAIAVGSAVGSQVGAVVGAKAGEWVGMAIGTAVGGPMGCAVGLFIGRAAGKWVGAL